MEEMLLYVPAQLICTAVLHINWSHVIMTHQSKIRLIHIKSLSDSFYKPLNAATRNTAWILKIPCRWEGGGGACGTLYPEKLVPTSGGIALLMDPLEITILLFCRTCMLWASEGSPGKKVVLYQDCNFCYVTASHRVLPANVLQYFNL
jgi:hypothetical protein